MALDNKKITDNTKVDDEDGVDTDSLSHNFDHISPQMVRLDGETDATSWNGSTCERESSLATPVKINPGSESEVSTTRNSRYPSSEYSDSKKAAKEKSYEFTCNAKCRRGNIHKVCFAVFCGMATVALAISLSLLLRSKSLEDTSELLKSIQHELNILKRELHNAKEKSKKEMANMTKTMGDSNSKMATELKSMKSLLEQKEENVNQRIENNEQALKEAKEEMSHGIDLIKADVKDTNDKISEEVKDLTEKINDSAEKVAKEVQDLETSLQNTKNKLSQQIQEVKSQVEDSNAGNASEQSLDNLSKKVDALESKQDSSDDEREKISQSVNGLSTLLSTITNELNNLKNKVQSSGNGSTRPGSWGIHLVLILLACFYLY